MEGAIGAGSDEVVLRQLLGCVGRLLRRVDIQEKRASTARLALEAHSTHSTERDWEGGVKKEGMGVTDVGGGWGFYGRRSSRR